MLPDFVLQIDIDMKRMDIDLIAFYRNNGRWSILNVLRKVLATKCLARRCMQNS